MSRGPGLAMKSLPRRLLWLLTGAAVVVAVDHLTKWLAQVQLQGRPPVEIIGGFFQLVYTENTGVAFGFLSGGAWSKVLLITLTLAAIGVIVIYAWRLKPNQWPTLVALMLILGGACGNLIDRVFRSGVIDFLDFYVGKYHWPAFNAADIGITCGGALLIIQVIRGR